MATTTTVAQPLDCGHPESPHGPHTTGYGTTPDGRRLCWDCGARLDRETMIRDGHSKGLPLYLGMGADGTREVTNWTGLLRFPVTLGRGYRVPGFGGVRNIRVNGTFTGPDGMIWSGFQQGDGNTIFHARRTKRTRGAGR